MRRRLVALLLPAALVALPVQAQFAPAGTFGTLAAATFGGTGIPNTTVMMNTFGGVTLGLSAHQRFPNPGVVTNNGAGTYYAESGAGVGGFAKWNFDYYIGGTPTPAYFYRLYYDFDSSFGNPTATLGNIVGTSFGEGSENLGFGWLAVTGGPITAPAGAFSAGASGQYNFALLQYERSSGHEVGRVAMNVEVSAVPEPTTYLLMATGMLGLGFVARRRKA